MTKEELEKDARIEDGEMLVRRFVGFVGYDYIEHNKRKTAHTHPDFSENTKVFWKEIEDRLQKPVVINFDREKCILKLKKEAANQAEMCRKADHASSYHYGLRQAYMDAVRIIEECLTN